MRFVIEMKFKRHNVTQDRKRKDAHSPLWRPRAPVRAQAPWGLRLVETRLLCVVSHVYVGSPAGSISVCPLSLSLSNSKQFA